jgi:hypothetical protein
MAKTDQTPTITCTKCSQTMRLVGIERDDTVDAERHIVTFVCPQDHYEAVTLPASN